MYSLVSVVIVFKDTATTEIYAYGHTLPLHAARPSSSTARIITAGSRPFRRANTTASQTPSSVTPTRIWLHSFATCPLPPGPQWVIVFPRVASTGRTRRSEEHTSELQSLMRISYDALCSTKKTQHYTVPTSRSS